MRTVIVQISMDFKPRAISHRSSSTTLITHLFEYRVTFGCKLMPLAEMAQYIPRVLQILEFETN